MKAITNTTVISNFANIKQLDVLRQLHQVIYISVEVYEEIQTGLEEGYEFYASIDEQIYPLETGWIKLTSMCDDQEFPLFHELPKRLHSGEASSLAIAYHRQWHFMTDNRAARTHAMQMGISLSDSLGYLILAVERHICTVEQANGWLTQMIE